MSEPYLSGHVFTCPECHRAGRMLVMTSDRGDTLHGCQECAACWTAETAEEAEEAARERMEEARTPIPGGITDALLRRGGRNDGGGGNR